MSTIQDLKDQRARVWEQMKGVMDVAERDGRDLSAEERATYDKAEGDLDRIGDQIERQEKFDARSAEFDKVDRSGVVPVRETPTAGERGERYERAFGAYLRNAVGDLSVEDRTVLADGFVDKRALGVGTNTAGGYTVPPGFRDQLIQTMKAYGGMLQVAEIINTDTGANLQWPTNDDTGNVGAILSENTQLTQQDVTLGTNSIDAYMYTSKLVLVSLPAPPGLGVQHGGLAAGASRRACGPHPERPLHDRYGFFAAGRSRHGYPERQDGCDRSDDHRSYDDLIDLIDSLDPAYQGNAQFMLSQSSRKAVRKLKDTTNQPLWQPSIQAGVPDQLLGYGYVINQDMPAPAANAKSVLFGDFRQAYLIRLVTDLR
jgi:predicted phage gp36 major capsid-like protein